MADPRVTQRHLLPLAELPPAQPKPKGGNRPYRRGATAERSLLQEFRQDGHIAIRSAGSAGPFDLVIALPGGGRLLQCKLCRETPTDATVARWLAALPAVPDGWTAELWVRGPTRWQSYGKDTVA